MSLTMILVIGVIVLVVFFAILAGATLLSLGEKHKSGHLPNDKRSARSRKGGGGKRARSKRRAR